MTTEAETLQRIADLLELIADELYVARLYPQKRPELNDHAPYVSRVQALADMREKLHIF